MKREIAVTINATVETPPDVPDTEVVEGSMQTFAAPFFSMPGVRIVDMAVAHKGIKQGLALAAPANHLERVSAVH